MTLTPRNTTPVKNIRSTRSDGGLTPIPSNDQHDLDLNDDASQDGNAEIHDPEIIKLKEKISLGLLKIKELDSILLEKSKVAKELKRDRIIRESLNGTPQLSTVNSDDEDDEDNESNFESKSVSSLVTKTFITETKIKSRALVGKDALNNKSTVSSALDQEATDSLNVKRPLKSYNQGDFIQRNIALGADARYYYAMTESEVVRVNQLLEASDSDASVVSSVSGNVLQPPLSRPDTSMSSGFYPEQEDLSQLINIDKKLQDFIPEIDWQNKSLIWSNAPSGTQTPRTDITSASSARYKLKRDIETILQDVDNSTKQVYSTFGNAKLKLQEIDFKLQNLSHDDDPDKSAATSEQIQQLLFELSLPLQECVDCPIDM